MNKEILHKKLSRYLNGNSMPSETRQIQNWLAIVDKTKVPVSEAEKEAIGLMILETIREETGYNELTADPKPWWQQILSIKS